MSRFDTYNRINSMVPSKGRPSLLVLLGSTRKYKSHFAAVRDRGGFEME